MKRYRIVNKRNKKKELASLIYDENKKEFQIIISKDQEIKKLPILLQASVSKGVYSMSPSNSLAWVRNRIVPSERKNIGSILKSYGLTNYREDLILEKTEGRSIQDDYMVIREQ